MNCTWWVIFFGVVVVLLSLDLGIFQRKPHGLSFKEALGATSLRVALALLFNLGIYQGWIGNYPTLAAHQEAGVEFLTGYLVEIALSMDNVFVFALIFRYFQIESCYQHRVLFWGILGALIMRAILIFAGIALLESFHWVLYVFAFILIYGGIKMIKGNKEEIAPDKNPAIQLIRRFLPITKELHGSHFFIRQNAQFSATPLFLVLVMIEITDLIFAVDSIPAVLAVTCDPFLVFTSNVFAILGLRALYFALVSILDLFHLLHYGLSAILIFIGIKMLLSGTCYSISTLLSLGVVLGILTLSIIASFIWPKEDKAST